MATAPTLFWYQLDTGTLAATYFGQLDTTVAALCSENSVTAPTAPWQNQISCSLVSTWLKQIDTAVRSLCTILSVTPPATTLPNLNVGQYEATYWAQLDACVRLLCAAPPPYHADAVHFDGSTNLHRTMAWADTPILSVSYWAKEAAIIDGVVWVIDPAGSAAPTGFFASPPTLQILSYDSNNDRVYTVDCSNPYPDGAWHHILVSINTNFSAGTKQGRIYIDDVDCTGTIDDADAAFTPQINNLLFQLANAYTADIADFWFDAGQSLLTAGNISEATRRKFISATGKPVDLGADGSTPTGTAPDIFFSGPAATFATNLGTGGAFTTTGTLTNASTSPSD